MKLASHRNYTFDSFTGIFYIDHVTFKILTVITLFTSVHLCVEMRLL